MRWKMVLSREPINGDAGGTVHYWFFMRVVLLLAPLLATGCDRTANTFEVRAVGATSADLTLCGQSTTLKRADGKFTGDVPIRCEGVGAIKVGFPDRPQVRCPIGYVTPGAVQSFKFEVDNGRCDASRA